MRSEPTSWREYARLLDAKGETQRAYQVLADAASTGEIAALVEHARMKWLHGEYAEANQLFNEAEHKAASDDADTHFAMHLAYELGLGTGSHSDLQRKSFEHLLVVGELERQPLVLLKIGLHYRDGLNGVEKNLTEADRWLSLAAQTGDADAAALYKRFMRQKKAGAPSGFLDRDEL